MSEITKTRSGRHRAPVRPATPFSGLSFAKVNTRRGVLTVASSSLAITMAATSAAAAPEETTVQARPDATITSATEQLTYTTPLTITAADGAADEVGGEVATANVELPPEPEPEPVVEQVDHEPAGEPVAEPEAQTQAAPEPEAEPVGDVAASGIGAQIVSIARQYVGTPYVHGGATPAGFDCSGFTQYVFAQAGISLPRTSGAQAGAGRVVSAAEAQPGDLVYSPGHIGIYTGNGQHIAARNPSTPLHESPIYMSSPTFIRVTG